MRTFTFLVLMLLTALSGQVWGQVSFSGSTYSQDFNIGTSATASLPSGFKFNTSANWNTGTTATVRSAGTTGAGALTGSSVGGIYNFANGVTGTSTDRSIGFLSSGSSLSPRSIVFAFTNGTGNTITDLNISFDYEKYRSGSRSFAWTFFHGSTATSINTSASAGDLTYPADADNTVISNPPLSLTKSFSIANLAIASGATYYLCWVYTGNGGSTNAQALGIDNFSLSSLPTNYYLVDFTTDPTQFANWTTSPTGVAGTQPSSFTADAQLFNITDAGNSNQATISLSGSWTISGTGSKLVVGDGGGNTQTFSIASSATFTGTIDLKADATLELVDQATHPTLTLGTVTTGATRAYNANAATISLPAGTYEKLKLTSTGANRVELAGNTTVSSALNMNGAVLNLNGNRLDLGTASTLSGTFGDANYIYGGIVRKMLSANISNFTFPVGDATNGYTPARLSLTANAYGASAYVEASVSAAQQPQNTSTDYINRTWTITGNDLTTPQYDLSLTYKDADIVGTEANMVLGKYSGGNWIVAGALNAATNTFSATNLTAFSEFTGGNVSTFPVELTTFTGTPAANAIYLDWATASEQNADRFIIERSADNQNFSTVGEEKAAGNSTSLVSYQFIDGIPLSGINYYRLRQLDMDGSAHFSSTVEVAFAPGKTALSLAPNPVAIGQQVALLSGHSGETTLRLYTLAGQEVAQLVFATGVYTASLPVLPAGLYLYSLSENGNLSFGRLRME